MAMVQKEQSTTPTNHPIPTLPQFEAREQLAVEPTARAAFARGEIAEQEIRWADAAKHCARAAALHPTYDTLYFAREFALRTGKYAKAIPLGTELIEAAAAEFGDTHEKYAAALSLHAVTLQATGQYDLAEPLFKQAIAVLNASLGPDHPTTKKVKANYQTVLKNRP